MACENAFRCTIVANVPSTLEDQRTRNTRKTVKTSYVNWDCSRWVKHCQPAHWKAVKTQFVHSCAGNDAVFLVWSMYAVTRSDRRPLRYRTCWRYTRKMATLESCSFGWYPLQMQLICLRNCVKSPSQHNSFSNVFAPNTKGHSPFSSTVVQYSDSFFFVCFGLILTGNADIAIRPREAAWSVKGSQAGIHFKHFY